MEGGAARTEERALGNLTSCSSGMYGGLVAAARTLLPLTSDQLNEFHWLTSARTDWLTSDQLHWLTSAKTYWLTRGTTYPARSMCTSLLLPHAELVKHVFSAQQNSPKTHLTSMHDGYSHYWPVALF